MIIFGITSSDDYLTDYMDVEIAKFLMSFENCIVGSKTYMQNIESQWPSNIKVLTRSKKFPGVKTVSLEQARKLSDSVVFGGRSTISSLLSYSSTLIIFRTFEEQEFGSTFPWNPNDWYLVEKVTSEGGEFETYARVKDLT